MTAPVYVNDETALATSTKAGTSLLMTYFDANFTSFNGTATDFARWLCAGGTSSGSSQN